MKICDDNFEIPFELQGEDVYNMFFVFDNEEEAVNYVVDKYPVDKEKFLLELHEEDFMRNEFGKENYLRGTSFSTSLNLRELLNGEYILWESY